MDKKRMSEVLKKLLSISTLLVVSLHAIIIHPHSDELSESEHIKLHNYSSSIYGILKIAFHEVHDESLDNLVIGQNYFEKKIEIKHSNSKITADNFQLVIERKATIKIRNCTTNKSNNLFFVNLNRLRGPPSLV